MDVDVHNINSGFAQLFKSTFCFTDDEFTMFLSRFQTKKISKKDFYLRAGDTCKAKTYLNKGCARNFVMDEQGHERILFFAFEDWWLGDFESFYTGNPGTNYIQAIEDCELLLITKEAFLEMEEKIPKLRQWYTYKMTRSASATRKRMEEMKTLSAEERYVNLLEKHPHIFQRVPLRYIAAFLNIEPPSLSRMRKRLAGRH